MTTQKQLKSKTKTELIAQLTELQQELDLYKELFYGSTEEELESSESNPLPSSEIPSISNQFCSCPEQKSDKFHKYSSFYLNIFKIICFF